MNKKNAMFQYDNGFNTIENTDLITMEEAESLWNKYIGEIKQYLLDGEKVQICIWQNCDTNTDYSSVLKEVDYIDCEVKNGKIYQVKRTLIQ